MAEPIKKNIIAVDWGIKEAPKYLWFNLTEKQVTFLEYYNRGNNHPKIRMDYQIALYSLYASVRYFFKQYLVQHKKEEAISLYDSLAFDKTIDPKKLLVLDNDFREWLFEEGPFRISEQTVQYEDYIDKIDHDNI
ncbi:hypothetical protein [Lutibacter sp.]|uniref:hypothetical protein n=1 Tax=Lutibacter sp. TaxID=1925666 RepID=UPI00349FE078